MRILLAIALSILPTQVGAGSLSFTKTDVDVQKLADELKDFTGLDFARPCSTCAVNGHIRLDGDGIEIFVYENKWADHVSTRPWTTVLQSSITTKVNEHAP